MSNLEAMIPRRRHFTVMCCTCFAPGTSHTKVKSRQHTMQKFCDSHQQQSGETTKLLSNSRNQSCRQSFCQHCGKLLFALEVHGKGSMSALTIARTVFPFLTLVHAITWQICKSHDEDGLCVQLFGLNASTPFVEDDTVPLHSQPRFWKRIFSSGESPQAKWLQDQLERKFQQQQHQHVRLELVRELSLALTTLCCMAIFTSSDRIRTQLLFIETIVFGLGAWDAIRRANLNGTTVGGYNLYLILVCLKLALVATVGLMFEASPIPPVADSTQQSDRSSVTSRQQFDKLPEDVRELMHESADAVVVVSPSSDPVYLPLYPGEEEGGIVVETTFKPSKDALVGISLKRIDDEERIVVSNVSASGLFASSSLQEGQTVLAINGIPMTEHMTAREAVTIIKAAEKEVSITVTRSLFVHVTKPGPSSKFGFSFDRMGKSDQLIIRKIHPASLLTATAAQEGMRVLAINQRACPASLSLAVEWVSAADSNLSLLIMPLATAGVAPNHVVAPQSRDDSTTTVLKESAPVQH